jgi:hypothetical protein
VVLSPTRQQIVHNSPRIDALCVAAFLQSKWENVENKRTWIVTTLGAIFTIYVGNSVLSAVERVSQSLSDEPHMSWVHLIKKPISAMCHQGVSRARNPRHVLSSQCVLQPCRPVPQTSVTDAGSKSSCHAGTSSTGCGQNKQGNQGRKDVPFKTANTYLELWPSHFLITMLLPPAPRPIHAWA